MKKLLLLGLGLQLQAMEQESKVQSLQLLCLKTIIKQVGKGSLTLLDNFFLDANYILDVISIDRQFELRYIKAVQGATTATYFYPNLHIKSLNSNQKFECPCWISSVLIAPDEKHMLIRDLKQITLLDLTDQKNKAELVKDQVAYIGFDKYRNILMHKQSAEFTSKDTLDLYSFRDMNRKTTLLREWYLEIIDYLKGSHRLVVRRPGRNYSVFDIKKKIYLYNLDFLKDLEVTSLAMHSRKNNDMLAFREDHIDHYGNSSSLLLYRMGAEQAELINSIIVDSNCFAIQSAVFDKTGSYLAVSTEEKPPKLHIYDVKNIGGSLPDISLITKTIPIPSWCGEVKIKLKWPSSLYIIESEDRDLHYCFSFDVNLYRRIQKYLEDKKQTVIQQKKA